MEGIFFIIVVLIVGGFIIFYKRPKTLAAIDGRQNYFFDNHQFSTKDFYDLVEKGIKSRQVPNVTMSRVNFSQTGMFSAKREYLRITRHNQTFDICAAPFGTGFFVSYWLGLQKEKSENKTYFQWDTEAMYKAIVKAAIDEAIDAMGPNAKATRTLSQITVGAQGVQSR